MCGQAQTPPGYLEQHGERKKIPYANAHLFKQAITTCGEGR